MKLSNNTTLRYLGQIKPGIAGNAGTRQTRPLLKKVKTVAIHAIVEGDLVTATAAATAIVDTGSILAPFAECGVNDGQDRLLSNPQDCRFMTEAFSEKPLQAKRLTSLATGTTHLKERFSIIASSPYAQNPEEVTLMEHDPAGDYYVFIKKNALDADQAGATDGGASLIATAGGGGGTVKLQNVVVRFYQEFVATGGKLPIFQPRWETDAVIVPGTDTAMLKPHLKNYYFQGMLWRQEVVGVSRVGDILNAFKQSQTGRVIVGDEMAATDDFQALIDGDFAGATYALGGVNPYVLFWYQRGGKLAKVLKPNDPNFTSTLSVQQSATAGTSRVGITYFLLDRDQTVRSDGTRVTLSNEQLAHTGLVI